MIKNKLFFNISAPVIAILTLMLFSNCSHSDKRETISPGSVVKGHELPSHLWKEWQIIIEKWRKSEYYKCLGRFRLRMNCSHCDRISILVRLKIGTDGKLTGYDIIGHDICGRKAHKRLEDCFMKYFKTIIFPEGLRNITIETILGTGLKC